MKYIGDRNKTIKIKHIKYNKQTNNQLLFSYSKLTSKVTPAIIIPIKIVIIPNKWFKWYIL